MPAMAVMDAIGTALCFGKSPTAIEERVLSNPCMMPMSDEAAPARLAKGTKAPAKAGD